MVVVAVVVVVGVMVVVVVGVGVMVVVVVGVGVVVAVGVVVGMTLDEKLTELEKESWVHLQGQVRCNFTPLLAALKKCREQRNHITVALAMNVTEATGLRYRELMDKGDAELLKILEGNSPLEEGEEK